MNISEQLSPDDILELVRKLGIKMSCTSEAEWVNNIHSPLREDKKPSFGFNVQTGAWKDHGTGETGDIITLIERVRGIDRKGAIAWVNRRIELPPKLPKNGSAEKQTANEEVVWTMEFREKFKQGHLAIKERKGHPLLKAANDYDCLEPETLFKFHCALMEEWGNEWLMFPYPTGFQLYRRQEGNKVIRAIKGSKPGLSFFGTTHKDKDTLFIAKSPRETMLLWQLYREHADVIGLCSGEVGSLSEEQSSILARLIQKSSLAAIYVWLDCDTETADRISNDFTAAVQEVASEVGFSGAIKRVNLHEFTDGRIKDISEYIREGMQPEIEELMKKSSKEVISNIHDNKSLDFDDFYALATQNKFIHIPTGALWPPASVNNRLPMVDEETKPSEFLSKTRSVEQMIWAPGYPKLIKDRFMENGGFFEHSGAKVYNLYKPPTIQAGDPDQAGMWLDLIRLVYPENAEHLINWLAHRIQKPGEKINHAILLGGAQGIGKDTILEPVRRAVGPWNFEDVSPKQLMGRFNGFVKSVVLRVSEARDLGDTDRYGFYEFMKTYTTAPPDVHRCDEKNRKEYGVLNILGVIITTNHKEAGIYLPADDRRHYVAWSEFTKDDFNQSYWNELWGWYENGGYEHIAAYLLTRNIEDFNPKAPPPKTEAFWEVVDAGLAPEDADMTDALEKLEYPDAVTIDMVCRVADTDFSSWLKDKGNRRRIPFRFLTAGYVQAYCSSTKDGRWRVHGKKVKIYAKTELDKRSRIAAAEKLASNPPENIKPPRSI